MSMIIHHYGCPDGWGSAWWLGKHLSGEVLVHDGRYGEPAPDCSGMDVYIVDFAYPAEMLDSIIAECSTLTVLDHHQTSLAWLEESKVTLFRKVNHLCDLLELGGDKAMAVLDTERSGVGLVAAFVERWQGVGMPPFLENIEDRDLWRFKLPDTREVFAAVTSRPYTVEAWDEMLAMPHEALVAEGTAIERYRQQLIATTVATARYETLFGFRVAVVAAPYAIGSDVAGVLAAADPRGFGAYYVDLPGKRRWGLRSAPGTGMDVAVLAESLGGGGHRHAAGFEVAT